MKAIELLERFDALWQNLAAAGALKSPKETETLALVQSRLQEKAEIEAKQGAMGIWMSDGGNGAFPADIIRIGDVAVVVANANLGGIQFHHPRATHAIVEVPDRVYSSKLRGIFVVPSKQLREAE